MIRQAGNMGAIDDLVLLGTGTVNCRVRIYDVNGALTEHFNGTFDATAGGHTLADIKTTALAGASLAEFCYGEIDVWGAAGVTFTMEYGTAPHADSAPLPIGSASTVGDFITYAIGKFPWQLSGVSKGSSDFAIQAIRDRQAWETAGWLCQDITGPVDTLVYTGACVFGGIDMLVAAAATVQVRDGVDSSGTLKKTYPASLAVNSYPGRPVDHGVGLWIKSNGATTITVYYKAAP